MAQGRANFTPGIDASLGLIFRLNILWQTADRKALAGDMEGWNFTLDRIYCNLSYRGQMNIEYEDKEKTIVKDIKMDKDEIQLLEKFKEKIRKVKQKRIEALKKKKRTEYNSANQEYYEVLTMKDIWLRKLMQSRNLYLKEVEFNASRAILGG